MGGGNFGRWYTIEIDIPLHHCVADIKFDIPDFVQVARLEIGCNSVAVFDTDKNAFIGNVTGRPISLRNTKFHIVNLITRTKDGCPDPRPLYRFVEQGISKYNIEYQDGLLYRDGCAMQEFLEDKWFIEETCVVCMDVKPNVLQRTCNHVVVCDSCYDDCAPTECMVCRTENTKVNLVIIT